MTQNNLSFSEFLKEHKEITNTLDSINLSDWLSICEILFQNEFSWVENDSYTFNPKNNNQELLDKINLNLNSILERSQLIESLSNETNEINETNESSQNNKIDNTTKELKELEELEELKELEELDNPNLIDINRLKELNQINIAELNKIKKEFNDSIRYYCWKKELDKELDKELSLYIAPGLIWLETVSNNFYQKLEHFNKKEFKDLTSFKDSYIELVPYKGFKYFDITKEDIYNFIPSYWWEIYKDLEQKGFKLERKHNIENLELETCTWSKVNTREIIVLNSSYKEREENIDIEINFFPLSKNGVISVDYDFSPELDGAYLFSNKIEFYKYLTLCDKS